MNDRQLAQIEQASVVLHVVSYKSRQLCVQGCFGRYVQHECTFLLTYTPKLLESRFKFEGFLTTEVHAS